MGSAAELRTQAYIAREIGILEKGDCSAIVDETKQLARMMQTLTKRILQE